MFGRVVNAVEGVALTIAAVFVILMFTYRPAPPPVAATYGATGAPNGQVIFAANCSRCHGAHGEGDIGPKLGGGQAAAKFPNETDEIAVVDNGEGAMPAWSRRLTTAEIKAVVDYTRRGL